jgi:hypothetical protein
MGAATVLRQGGLALAALVLAAAAPVTEPATVVAGLKEALRVGARNAVAATSRVDGFWLDPRIRIPIPDSLEAMTSGLRRFGFGSQVDEFELGMNRAAEQAAAQAFDVFAAAIGRMSVEDAYAILRGGDTAATQYFQRTTSDELQRRFRPIVERSMEKVGLVQLYDRMLVHWRSVPMAPQPRLDLRQYVTERSLSGLFVVLGEEEKKIRTDPAARVTDLLRKVFG